MNGETTRYSLSEIWLLAIALAGVVLMSGQMFGAMVEAATFDSHLVPAVANTYKLGAAAGDWQSINNTIFFSGANVGIGVASPAAALEVNGGMRLNTLTARPACAASERGTIWVAQSSVGVKDTVAVCIKNASDVYTWATIY